jgi:Sigma-70 factor, region 1.1
LFPSKAQNGFPAGSECAAVPVRARKPCEFGLEGLVFKRADRPYPGDRSKGAIGEESLASGHGHLREAIARQLVGRQILGSRNGTFLLEWRSRPECPVDLADTIRKLVLAADSGGEITVDIFKELTPSEVSADDIERLIDSLNAQGIWIVDEKPRRF